MTHNHWPAAVLCLLGPVFAATAQPPSSTDKPFERVIELNVGDSLEVELADGKTVFVKLVDLKETRDTLRQAVRCAEVTVEVAGQKVALVSANYRLPVTVAGVQIDCPITKGYLRNNQNGVAGEDPWGLDKDARLRLWPANSPFVKPGTFTYPAKQRWFASSTQMSNEPSHVDGGEDPLAKRIYYHYGLDIGGAEAMVQVVAATGNHRWLRISLGILLTRSKAEAPGGRPAASFGCSRRKGCPRRQPLLVGRRQDRRLRMDLH
jgi:hypothetical protein